MAAPQNSLSLRKNFFASAPKRSLLLVPLLLPTHHFHRLLPKNVRCRRIGNVLSSVSKSGLKKLAAEETRSEANTKMRPSERRFLRVNLKSSRNPLPASERLLMISTRNSHDVLPKGWSK